MQYADTLRYGDVCYTQSRHWQKESSLCSLHKAIVWADLFLFTVRLQAKHKCTVSAVLVHGRQNVRVGLWLVRLLLYFYVII